VLLLLRLAREAPLLVEVQPLLMKTKKKMKKTTKKNRTKKNEQGDYEN
jgi:hypothetical protein